MVSGAALAPALLAIGCSSEAPPSQPYAYNGQYELVAVQNQSDGCDGELQDAPIPDEHRWFRLESLEVQTGPLIAWYACIDPGRCSSAYDLYYSFGTGPDGWSTRIYAAVNPPCQLSYQLRVLSPVDASTIKIEALTRREIQESVASEACDYSLAKSRGSDMPCVAREIWTARRLPEGSSSTPP
jgi:hypothetical protein